MRVARSPAWAELPERCLTSYIKADLREGLGLGFIHAMASLSNWVVIGQGCSLQLEDGLNAIQGNMFSSIRCNE